MISSSLSFVAKIASYFKPTNIPTGVCYGGKIYLSRSVDNQSKKAEQPK